MTKMTNEEKEYFSDCIVDALERYEKKKHQQDVEKAVNLYRVEYVLLSIAIVLICYFVVFKIPVAIENIKSYRNVAAMVKDEIQMNPYEAGVPYILILQINHQHQIR